MHVVTSKQLRTAKRAKRIYEEDEIAPSSEVLVCPACGSENAVNVSPEGEEAVFVCGDCDNEFVLVNTDFVEAIAPDTEDGVNVAVITTDEDGDLDAVVVEVDPEVEVEDVIEAIDEIPVSGEEGAITDIAAAEPDDGEVGIAAVDDVELGDIDVDFDEEIAESRRRTARRPGRRPSARRGARRPSRRARR